MTNPDELERLARAALVLLGHGAFGDHANAEWAAFRRAAGPATVLALLSANREMRTATPDLTAVIAWLKNGCDPAHAVTELQIYQDRIARSAARSAPPPSVEEFGSSAEGADTHRVAETAVVARPTGVRLEGRMDGPNPMMRVIIERADGTEYEAIQDNGTIISHWAHIP